MTEFAYLIEFRQDKNNPEIAEKASKISENLKRDRNFCKVVREWDSQKEIIARKRAVFSLAESARKAFGMQNTKQDMDNFILPVELHHLVDDVSGIISLVVTAMAYKEALSSQEKQLYSGEQARKAYCVLASKSLGEQVMMNLKPFIEKRKQENAMDNAAMIKIAENSTGHSAGKV